MNTGMYCCVKCKAYLPPDIPVCENAACDCHLKQAERKIDEALLFNEGEY